MRGHSPGMCAAPAVSPEQLREGSSPAGCGVGWGRGRTAEPGSGTERRRGSAAGSSPQPAGAGPGRAAGTGTALASPCGGFLFLNVPWATTDLRPAPGTACVNLLDVDSRN